MNYKATDCFSIFGTRGTGKSYLARKINGLYPRSVVIDPTKDWTDGEIVRSFTEFSNKLKEKLNNNKKEFRIIFQFNPDEPNKEELLNHVLRLCFHFKNIQVVIDEVQLFTSANYLPDYLKNLLFMGRHNGISVMCITQRPSQLNKSILSQSLHVYCGQLHDKNDLNAVSSFLNTDTNKLFNLKKRHFIYFNPEIGTKEITTE